MAMSKRPLSSLRLPSELRTMSPRTLWSAWSAQCGVSLRLALMDARDRTHVVARRPTRGSNRRTCLCGVEEHRHGVRMNGGAARGSALRPIATVGRSGETCIRSGDARSSVRARTHQPSRRRPRRRRPARADVRVPPDTPRARIAGQRRGKRTARAVSCAPSCRGRPSWARGASSRRSVTSRAASSAALRLVEQRFAARPDREGRTPG